MSINIIVQGSSRSWSGSPDNCMNLVENFPVVYWTLKKLVENFPKAKIVLAAPLFDKNGPFSKIVKKFNGRVDVYFGNNNSPLLRMIDAHSKFFKNETYFLRIDSLNMFVKPEDLKQMHSLAVKDSLDCFKFPDDYPVQFTADIYKIDALVKMRDMIPANSPFVIHPKYFIMTNSSFRHGVYSKGKLSKKYLIDVRRKAKNIYLERGDMSHQSVEGGDQLSFHYTLALPYIKKSNNVLDVACGTGFGLTRLAERSNEVCGADISKKVINTAGHRVKHLSNIKLIVADVTNLPFGDETFDVITSFETLEHVDADLYKKELWRVLKAGGLLIVSTPQNNVGAYPVNSNHIREYSLEEFKCLFDDLFEIEKIIGIKQGTIFFKDDSYGNNTFAVLKKRSL